MIKVKIMFIFSTSLIKSCISPPLQGELVPPQAGGRGGFQFKSLEFKHLMQLYHKKLHNERIQKNQL